LAQTVKATRQPPGDRLALRAVVESDQAGKVASVRITVREGKPAEARTTTFGRGGCGVATYDRAGQLLAVQVKGRVAIGDLARTAERESAAVRRFLRDALPTRLLMFMLTAEAGSDEEQEPEE
jgi:hypothetical protein